MFLNPVAASHAEYHQIIREPMCLKIIQKKVREGRYAQAQEVYQDLKLIAKNCLQYCRGKPFWLEMKSSVGRFVRVYEKLWKALIDQLRVQGFDGFSDLTSNNKRSTI